MAMDSVERREAAVREFALNEAIQNEAKLAALGAAIDVGDSSGIAEGDVFERVRKAPGLPAAHA
jgi:hypothetical protein